MQHFATLFEEASRSERFDATRAALATVGRDGRPTLRYVLVREADTRGFAFYTDYRSRKSLELEMNPHAALAWHWETIGVQVRVEGAVRRVSAEQSDAYFKTRPRGSQIGAWASQQSSPIASRAPLDAAVREAEMRFAGIDVERPPHWGGWLVVPAQIEFWFNQDHRLHDRYLFTRESSGWRAQRLAP